MDCTTFNSTIYEEQFKIADEITRRKEQSITFQKINDFLWINEQLLKETDGVSDDHIDWWHKKNN